MDTNAQWPQGIGVVKPQVDQKKPRPQKEQALNCPRCSSTNTKFCYYNNYSLSQPRYFCKTCRRYWTEGGTLRNVPVGGGSRKNKRSSSTVLPASVNSSKKLVVPSPPDFSPQSSKIHQGQDLNLAYNPSQYNGFPEFVPFPFGSDDTKNLESRNPNNTSPNPSYFPVMELLKTGISSRGSLGSFMTNIPPVSDHSNPIFSSGNTFPVNGFKSSLGFSLDHGVDSQNGYGNLQDHANSSRLLFPFEELKPVSTNEQFEQDRGQAESNGYWNGMLAEGSW